MQVINDYWQKTIQAVAAFLPHLLSAVVTLVIGLIIIRLFKKIMMRLINASISPLKTATENQKTADS